MTSPEAAPPAVATRVDFPGWLPPMLVKELRQSLRAKGFIGLFATFHLLAIVIFWWAIEINAASGLRATFDWINRIYWGFLMLVMLLIVPLRGLGGLRNEIDHKTLDLLMLTRLTSWRIVFGKWVAIVAQAVLFLVALLPYGVVRYFFGSVDLAGDLLQTGWMLLISAVFAAATLWVSGLPKIFRILLPIGLFFSIQGLGFSSLIRAMSASSRGTGVSSSSFSFANWGWAPLLACLVLAAIFLGLAVRRIAPPAENHSLVARLLGFVLLLGAAVGPLLFSGFSVRNAAGLGFFAVIAVAVIEMSRDCLPMYSHWRPWSRRGFWRAALGRLLLPGWPSAAAFAAVVLTLLAIPALFFVAWRPETGATLFTYVWWLTLAWQALVFPAVLLSFVPSNSSLRIGGSGYFVVHGLFGIMSMLCATNSVSGLTNEHFAQTLYAFCQMLPIASFWLGAQQMKSGFSATNLVGQSAALLILVALVWRQSRLYWATITRFDRYVAEDSAPTA